MQRVKAKNGFIALKCDMDELQRDSRLLCESCEKQIASYYIPVLERCMCRHCFAKWERSARRYSTSNAYELDRERKFIAKIGVTV